jgi:hypothetical protein
LAHGEADGGNGQHNTLEGGQKMPELLIYGRKTPKKQKKPREQKQNK